MKYNTILLAGFLPIIVAQSAVSGAAQPTGFTPGEKPTAKWSNSTNVAGPNGSIKSLTPSGSSALPSGNVPNPYGLNSKSSTEGLGIKAESTSSDVSSSTASHVPYTPGAGVHFANSTGASFDNVLVYPTGTGASSGFAKPTNSPQGTAAGTGHLPYTSGTSFLNATAGSDGGVVVSSVLPTSSGVSSGFAKPTNSLQGAAAGTGHLPYTSRAPFANTTVGSNGGVNANSILPTGTGISSGFAKPSAVSNFTRPAGNATRPATTTGRLPFISSKGLYFGNSTSSGFASTTDDSSLNVASATGLLSTGVSSGFSVQTASAAGLTNTTSTFAVRPTGFLTGVTVPASQVTAIPSGKPLWTNSTTISKAPSSSFIPGTGVASIPTTIPKVDASSITIKFNETSSTIISSSTSRLPTLSVIPPYSNSTISATKSAAPTTFGTVTVPSTVIPSSAVSAPSAPPVTEYYQCGGLNWSGSKTCSSGMTCKEWNPYYHQCVRE